MVQQVFATERGISTLQLAFGTHPEIEPGDGVTNGLALRQKIRVVVDELLDGTTLEQVGCTNGDFSDIPRGTTPDDIADCAGVDTRNCTAVCTDVNPTTGQPYGVIDEDDDGAADVFRFKENAVDVLCEGEVMPLVLEGSTKSFWNPSGNQQIPAGNGVAGLGPAVVLVPESLRTGSNCGIRFASSVVDKDGNPVCAPPNGDITKPCNENDTSLIAFSIEPFGLVGTAPQNGQTNVSLASAVFFTFNMLVDADSVAGNFSLSDQSGPVAFTAMISGADPAIVQFTLDAGLQPDRTYTMTATGGANGVTDIYGGFLPADVSIMFTTVAGTPTPDASTAPDGGVADAGAPDAA